MKPLTYRTPPHRPRAETLPAAGFTLLSDTVGEITRIAVKLPCGIFTDDHQCEAYRNLLGQLAGLEMVIVAVTADRYAGDIAARLGNFSMQTFTVPDAEFNASSVWARDCVLCATRSSDGERIFLHANGPGPYSLAGPALWLSRHVKVPVQHLDFLLAGGSSLVVDDQHWIVGAEGIEREMMAGKNLTWSRAIKKIASGIGRPPIIAGYRFKDTRRKIGWVHRRVVSTARTLLPADFDKAGLLRRVLTVVGVGTISAFSVTRDLLTPGRLYPPNLSHIDLVVSVTGRFRGGKPVVLVADATLPAGPPKGPVYNAAQSWKVELDSIAKVLAERFCVVRNPAPYSDGGVLAYNNTIVQADLSVVMLPVFSSAERDFRASDKANADIWKELGFRVIQVPGWTVASEGDGCIRCATLPLDRKPSSKPADAVQPLEK